MAHNDIFRRVPELQEFIDQMKHEFNQLHRPPDQVIWDDVDLRENLKVSQRTTATWRQDNIIAYSKVQGKIFYKLSDVLEMIEKNKIPAISDTLKIKL
jgi:hypothetical protein